jgi:hypothetical protein
MSSVKKCILRHRIYILDIFNSTPLRRVVLQMLLSIIKLLPSSTYSSVILYVCCYNHSVSLRLVSHGSFQIFPF